MPPDSKPNERTPRVPKGPPWLILLLCLVLATTLIVSYGVIAGNGRVVLVLLLIGTAALLVGDGEVRKSGQGYSAPDLGTTDRSRAGTEHRGRGRLQRVDGDGPRRVR